MSQKSRIEWTEATWNPVRGCTKISPGCKNCYAETFAERFRGVPGHPYEFGFDLRLVPERLSDPFRWRESRTIFVNSMSDLLHERIPDDYIIQVVRVMQMANWHTFQVLTKRAERLEKMFERQLAFASDEPHIWWGVSVEDKKYGLPRVEHLRRTIVATRFLSIEPLLEDLGPIDLSGIHWVIVGGESGPRARPMERKWVESIRKQCTAVRVPFFFKQWGGFPKSKQGRTLNGRTYDALPKIRARLAPDDATRMALIRISSQLAA